MNASGMLTVVKKGKHIDLRLEGEFLWLPQKKTCSGVFCRSEAMYADSFILEAYGLHLSLQRKQYLLV